MLLTIILEMKILKVIRKRIIKFLTKGNYKEIGNRALAIKDAMISSDIDEIILIAGKGHEETQIFGKKIFKVSDQKIINEVNLKNQKKSFRYK